MIFAEMAVLITKFEKTSERFREKMDAANECARRLVSRAASRVKLKPSSLPLSGSSSCTSYQAM